MGKAKKPKKETPDTEKASEAKEEETLESPKKKWKTQKR